MSKSDLAFFGGDQVRKKPMPPRLALGIKEREMIVKCLDYYKNLDQDPGYEGHFEEMYCEKFCNFMGGGFVDAVATGTASIYIALSALNLPKNSNVLVSPITDPGTISSIILNGLRPKLIDTMQGSYNAGPLEVSERIDKNTSCILIIHTFGEPAPIDEICKVAKKYNLKVIEDCSQAHGAVLKGKKVGSFGDVSAFSTMYRKGHMTGASGGVVYTKSKKIYRQALAHADRGKPRWDKNFSDRDPSTYLFPALNFNTDEISCAIGLASLERLEKSNEGRRNFLEFLISNLEKSIFCDAYNFNNGFAPFVYPIMFNKKNSNITKLKFAEYLIAEGIPLNPHYRFVVDEWPWIKKYLFDNFIPKNAKYIRDNSFCLYLNEKYGKREADDIINCILKIEKHI